MTEPLDDAMARQALGRVAHLDDRSAAEEIGVSHASVNAWRQKVAAGERIRFRGSTRAQVEAFLDQTPPGHAMESAIRQIEHAVRALRQAWEAEKLQ